MLTSDFNFQLPQNLIAQKPAYPRDSSRLMVLNRANQTIQHKHFYDLPDLLEENYVLVFNKSKVMPARLFALPQTNNVETKDLLSLPSPYEIFLIKQINKNSWICMVKPGKKFQIGSEFQILTKDQQNLSEISCTVEKINEDGTRILKFESPPDPAVLREDLGDLLQQGHMPFPPYIHVDQNNEKQFEKSYQTVYADESKAKSIAAPTAGLHFTEKLLQKLKNKGIRTEFVTLHVGMGTFLPVKSEKIEDHQMHSEFFELENETAERLNEAKKQGKKIISVGTTSTRVLESCANKNETLNPKFGETNIFIYPGYQFKFIDTLITNFHLPQSTLLMLISTFAGKDFVFKAYEEAIKEKYRFYSFGDAMIII